MNDKELMETPSQETAATCACMEVAGLESMVDCEPPSVDLPLEQ